MVSSPTPSATALWPPDDTEESVVGVVRHQLDIRALCLGLNEEAQRLARGGPVSWQAVGQIMLLGCRRPDGSAYTTYPDVAVYPRPVDGARGSCSLAADGPPLVIVEVASPDTVSIDLDLARGKGWSYADAGVAEYLVLDPTLALVPGGGRGWRLAGGVYRPWTPDAQGRWQSARLPVAFGSEGGLAAVFGRAGRQLREGEIGAALHEQFTQGQLEGARETVRRIVRLRFGAAPALEQRIASADAAELERLLHEVLAADDASGQL